MKELTKTNIDQGLAILKERMVDVSLQDYAYALKNTEHSNHKIFPKRKITNTKSLVLHSGTNLEGIAITARYDVQGGKLFNGKRTLDEISLIYVPDQLQARGTGREMFNYAFTHILTQKVKQPTQWIYVQSRHPAIEHMIKQLAVETKTIVEEHENIEHKDYILDLRDIKVRNKLLDYCGN